MAFLRNMSFSQALNHLKIGSPIGREGWNGKELWIRMQQPDAQSKMTQPYCYMETPTGQRIPWVPSQGDLFAEDWMVE